MWKLVLNSLVLFSMMTLAMLCNATRTNLDWGIPDEMINVFIFILSTQGVMVTAYIPTQIQLTFLVPHNAEASIMSLISSIFFWSYEIAAKWCTAFFCNLFHVDDEHMDNYKNVLLAKLPLFLLVMCMTKIIPTNRRI